MEGVGAAVDGEGEFDFVGMEVQALRATWAVLLAVEAVAGDGHTESLSGSGMHT